LEEIRLTVDAAIDFLTLLIFVSGACGHAEPRPGNAAAQCRRQFAAGVPAFAKATAGPP